MKASVYIATSLDGFIAREDGGLDWLPPVGQTPEAEDYGYQAFMATVEALVMGRYTFAAALTMGEWGYGAKRVFVLGHGAVAIPPELAGTVEARSGPPAEVLAGLAAQGIRHVYVDGGKTIQGFLAAGLIDELILTRVPVLLGQGIPLFGPLAREVRLQHVETRAFADGLVQSHYRVARAAA